MRKRNELVGHGIELVGLTLVFITILWQSILSDWWESQLYEWQSSIQENLIVALQHSVANLADLETAQNQKQRQELAQEIKKNSIRALEDANRERNKRRNEMESGQAALFIKIKIWLTAAGALIFAIGKFFTLWATMERSEKGKQ